MLELLASRDQGFTLEDLVAHATAVDRSKKVALTHVSRAVNTLMLAGFVGRRLVVGRPGTFTWHIAPSARAALAKAPSHG